MDEGWILDLVLFFSKLLVSSLPVLGLDFFSSFLLCACSDPCGVGFGFHERAFLIP
jgi:hypothetical protein